MLKYYPVQFRDDYNGRPRIIIMSDGTRFLVVHPFCCCGKDNYDRFYTYYSLDDNFDLDNKIELWIRDIGTGCIENYWSEFKQAIFASKNNIQIADTTITFKRIPNAEFTPKSLEQLEENKWNFLTKKTTVVAKSDTIYGYIKFDSDTFIITNIVCTFEDSDEELYLYRPYLGELADLHRLIASGVILLKTKHKKYLKGHITSIAVHKDNMIRPTGTVYGLADKGVVLCLGD